MYPGTGGGIVGNHTGVGHIGCEGSETPDREAEYSVTSYLLVLRVASDMVPTTGAHAPCTGVTHGAAGVSGAAVAVAAT